MLSSRHVVSGVELRAPLVAPLGALYLRAEKSCSRGETTWTLQCRNVPHEHHTVDTPPGWLCYFRLSGAGGEPFRFAEGGVWPGVKTPIGWPLWLSGRRRHGPHWACSDWLQALSRHTPKVHCAALCHKPTILCPSRQARAVASQWRAVALPSWRFKPAAGANSCLGC